MMRLNSYLTYSAFLLCALAANFSFAQSAGSSIKSTTKSQWRFKASNDVPREQQEILRQDIEAFAKMPFIVNDETFSKVMGLEGEVKAKDLVNWLSLRAKILIGESYEMSEKDSYVASSGYNFQYPGILPDIPQPPLASENSPSVEPPPADSENSNVITIMSNIGVSLYLNGKENGVLLGVNMPGLGKIPVTSPRVGILKIGRGLFSMGRTKNNTLEIDSSLMRVATLFHEARHSDGNRKSAGFLHAICPAGHDFAGYAACDFGLNGSYSVGFQVGKAAAENCAACTVAQREALRLDYLDSYSRVILKQEVTAGTSDELDTLYTLKDNCKMLLSYGANNSKIVAMCEGLDKRILKAEAKQSVEAKYLDATPEGKL
jgi:hypothetical protein